MNKRIYVFIVSILIAVVALTIVLVPKQQPPSNATPNSFIKGVSLSPKSFGSSDFTDFFSKAQQAGTVISWAGDWNELGDPNSGAAVLASLSKTYGYEPVIEVQFFNQSTGALLRPFDNATTQHYKDITVAFVTQHKLKYLGIGIEVNILYEKSPTDFGAFIQLYNQVYAAVKAKSPETKIFTVFQLEKMKGLNGGLYGGTNNPNNTEWQLLDKFTNLDLVAFTTYPSLIYKNPNDMPANYYSEIKQHTEKPIAFTEIGWHSNPSPSGWESSNTEQALFVTTFFNLTKSLSKELAIWTFLYDQNTTAPFNSMGLWSTDGTAKPSWNIWITTK